MFVLLKRSLGKISILMFFSFSFLSSTSIFANNPSIQEKNIPDTQPSIQSEIKSEQSGEKGGIYAVGREFKEAGGEIKKGGSTVGNFFSGIGRSVKSFFTGEKDNSQGKASETPQKSDPLDHRGDEAK